MAEVRWRNVHRSDPCRICGKPDWCSRSDDGGWALCRRIDAGGEHRVDRSGAEYWLHCLGEAPLPRLELPAEPQRERGSSSDLDRVYRAVLEHLSLSAEHRAALRGRGLDEAGIDAGRYRTLPPRGRAALARSMLELFPARLLEAVPGFCLREGDRGRYLSVSGPAGLVVPVVDLERCIVALKVRRDEPGDGAKYLYVSSTGAGGPGPGSPVHVPTWSGSTDQVRVTEGELKADVATRLSGVLTISVPGVSAWRGALPVLVALAPTRVLLAFDADARSNPHVAQATEATATALAEEGYEVALETWESNAAKGIDDALAGNIAIQVESKGRRERSPATNEACYRATPDGIVWDRPTATGPARVRLTNFSATITREVVQDDGAELRRSFEIEARLNGDVRRFSILAETFAGISWTTEHLGARAVIFPGFGLRDHVRTAIQILSGHVPERRVYSHTGWRHLDGGWAYLHGGGAIGALGAIPGTEVALPESLASLNLPDPPASEDLRVAIKSSLSLLDVAPDPISFPILAAVYRAVIGHVDFSVHIAGPSGAGKTELASLAQRHFGPAMDARNLPGSWLSTGNALEMLAFAAKDALLVVDDFAPGGQATDVERAHRDAERLLRAQGNRAGRLRMRADGTLRAPKPPRGLIISTGEDVPRGHSIRARLFVCDVSPDDIRWKRLSACQRDAAHGQYAKALSGFVAWMAPRYEEIRDSVAPWVRQLQDGAVELGTHRRTPEIVSNLAAGLGFFLAFAGSSGALTAREQDELWHRGWSALGRAAWAQSQHVTGAEPARRFLELLRAAIASGRAHLANPAGDRPELDDGTWGWRRNQFGDWEPRGDRVGWLDGDHVYLESDAAYAVAQRLGQEVGDRLALTPHTLRRRLRERGVLVSTDVKRETLTVRRTVEGLRREVLHLASASISLPAAPERPESGAGETVHCAPEPAEPPRLDWSGFG